MRKISGCRTAKAPIARPSARLRPAISVNWPRSDQARSPTRGVEAKPSSDSRRILPRQPAPSSGLRSTGRSHGQLVARVPLRCPAALEESWRLRRGVCHARLRHRRQHRHFHRHQCAADPAAALPRGRAARRPAARRQLGGFRAEVQPVGAPWLECLLGRRRLRPTGLRVQPGEHRPARPRRRLARLERVLRRVGRAARNRPRLQAGRRCPWRTSARGAQPRVVASAFRRAAGDRRPHRHTERRALHRPRGHAPWLQLSRQGGTLDAVPVRPIERQPRQLLCRRGAPGARVVAAAGPRSHDGRGRPDPPRCTWPDGRPGNHHGYNRSGSGCTAT